MPRKRKTLKLSRPELIKQVIFMTESGKSAAGIAEELHISDRYVRTLRAQGRKDGALVIVIPPPREFSDLDAEIQACLTRNTEGYELFYNRYSGLALPAHAKDWVSSYLASDRVLLNCPPRHAKSKIFSVWIPLWELSMNRDIQILLVTQTHNLAKKWALEIAWHLEFNKKMITELGMFKPTDDGTPWRPLSGELMVQGRKRDVKMGDLTVQIRGAGQQIIGMEADLIVADDICDPKKMRSVTYVEELSEYFHGEVMTRLSPTGRACVVGQRVHFQDLYQELMEKRLTKLPGEPPLWTHMNFPAIIDWKDQTVLWPEVWSFERLMKTFEDIKRKGNASLFETMYQQNPQPPEETLVREEWLYGDAAHIGCLDDTRPYGSGIQVSPKDAEAGTRYIRVVSLDPSPTRQAGLIVADVLHSRTLFQVGLLEVIRKPMDVREMVAQLKRVTEMYRPDWMIFEKNAAQRWFLQDFEFTQLRKAWDTRLIEHTTHSNKADPIYGVGSLASDFEFGRIRLPWGDPDGREQSKKLIEEALQYPYGPYDDLLMALWFVKWNFQRLSPRNKTKPVFNSMNWNSPPRLAKGWSFLDKSDKSIWRKPEA